MTVTISTSDIPSDDLANVNPDDGNDGVYSDHLAVNRYEGDPNIFMLGITSPDGFQHQTAAFASRLDGK